MYLRLVELVRTHKLPCDNFEWQPGGRRITLWFRRIEPRASADLEWDTEARTLLVRDYKKSGERDTEVSFDCTVTGVEQAIALVRGRFS